MSLFREDPRRIEQLEIKTTSFDYLLTDIRIKVGTLETRIDDRTTTFNGQLGGVRTDVSNLQTRVGQLPTKTNLMWAVGLILPFLALFSVLYYNEISSKTDVFTAKIEPITKKLDTVSDTVDQLKSTVDGLTRPVPGSAPTKKP